MFGVPRIFEKDIHMLRLSLAFENEIQILRTVIRKVSLKVYLQNLLVKYCGLCVSDQQHYISSKIMG